MSKTSKETTKYCSYYWIFEPIGGDIIDGAHRKPAFEIPARYDGEEYYFSLFCRNDNGAPEYARINISKLDKEELPEDILPFLQILKEHLLSVLRIFYDREVKLFNTVWLFRNEGESPELHINITEKLGTRNLNPKLISDLFCSSMDCREEVRLLADAIDERIPLQYRFLSYYKIIENEFKSKGRWQTRKLDQFLSDYISLFKNAGFHSKPAALLHEVRDRCAHIKTGGKKEVIGVTHLNHKEAVRTDRLLPILKEICINVVNKKAGGRFLLSGKPLTPEQIENFPAAQDTKICI